MTDVGVILQSLCHLHHWTRSPDDSAIYERPERLQSIRLGIAAIHARLNSQALQDVKGKQREDTADLEDLLDSLSLKTPNTPILIHDGHPFSISTSSRRLPLSSPAVTLAHGKEYIPKLLQYIANVKKAHASQTSEVPAHLSQGDLYLCETTLQALEGALGACCDAVDQVLAENTTSRKRFVSIRPPGHHCETQDPMGFCWLNNVAVAAAHGEPATP
jgi:histone deacetylase HOS3